MICEIRWPKPHEHCTWCDKDLKIKHGCASCGGDTYHYAGCGVGEHGEVIPSSSLQRVLVDGRGWVYCGLPCLLITERAVIETEIIDALS